MGLLASSLLFSFKKQSKGDEKAMEEQRNNQIIPLIETCDQDEAQEKPRITETPQLFKAMLLVLLVLQTSSFTLVGRHTRSLAAKEDLYSVNHLILICEILKLVFSGILEWRLSNGQFGSSIKLHIIDHPRDALNILVPALLYLCQTSLLYVALTNLSAPIFQVTYQGKLVTTAIVSVVVLKRKYALQQWVSLVVLSLGVSIVLLDEKDAKIENQGRGYTNFCIGLYSVAAASFSSALAGVYFEYVVKKPFGATQTTPPPSLWIRNMQLAFFSICIALGQEFVEMSTSAGHQGYFHGFTKWVWVLVCLQVGGGLLVAAVIKYADNVLKGMATGVSVVTSTACSAFFFGTPLTGQFLVGATMILISVFWFSIYS